MGAMTTSVPGGRRIRGLDAEQRRAQRRDQLLTAAFDLFAQDGYVNTSIEQICQTAYVGNKAFYELFDSKEDCFLALLNQIGDRLKGEVEAELGRSAPDEPEELTVRRVATTFAHVLVDDPRVAVVAFRECTGISPQVEARRQENRRWAAAFIEAFWRSKAPPDADYRAMAVATVGGLFELVADFLHATEPPRSIDELANDLTSFVLAVGHGIRHAGPVRSNRAG
ncbi:TetR/AcrR family transcriptional regulator [Mycolicibacter algericus]|nr:TetR/AcrR family transcriptional regulator [Mycolicibacter algericus]OQZ94418.1 TetR family transcriptional regulator [Mycolicibacter algericus DSM 45454]